MWLWAGYAMSRHDIELGDYVMFLNSKLTMQVFGLYLVVMAGLGFMLAPHFLLGLFGLIAGDDAWIRMVGMLASIIGAYYLLAAQSGVQVLYRWSIPIRIYAASFMILLFLLGTLPAGILLFAAVDFFGALWTWAALRAEKGAVTAI
jgi:hypothetical protein